MRVSLVSSATGYPAMDSLANLARTLLRRGDEVRLFSTGAAKAFPPPLRDLIQGAPVIGPELLQQPAFLASDLYVYHYVTPHAALDTLLELGRGVVILYCQPPDLSEAEIPAEEVVAGDLVRLAAASDLVVVEDDIAANRLRSAGAAEPNRLHIVAPAISLSDYTPGTPDTTLRSELDLLGKRVLLTSPAHHSAQEIAAVQACFSRIQEQIPEAILVSVPNSSASSSTFLESETIRILPATGDMAPYYRLADLYLAPRGSRAVRQHTLEAMACGLPVVDIVPDYAETWLKETADTAIRLLRDDILYGEAVRRSLEIAADHSLEASWQAWSSVFSIACGWLPVRLSAERSPLHTRITGPAEITGQEIVDSQATGYAFGIDLEGLKTMASVTLRDYEVRSPTPVFGPFIAWVRRNLTSHLRKPYLDPTLDRQEVFNLRAANALQDLATRLAAFEESSVQREDALRHETKRITEQLSDLLGDLPVDAADAVQVQRVADIRRLFVQMRNLLSDHPAGADASPEG